MNVTKFNNTFNGWQKDIVNLLKGIATNLIIPVVLVGLIVFLIVQIVQIVSLRRSGRGGEISDRIFPLVITVIVMVILGTAQTWAWNLL